MKKVLLLIAFWQFSITGFSQNSVYKLKTTDFDISIPNYYNYTWGLAGSIGEGTASTFLYTVNGIEHIVTYAGSQLPTPALHFVKTNGIWQYKGYFDKGNLDGLRNYAEMDSLGSFTLANTGTEAINPWPYGDLMVMKTISDSLSFSKLSKAKTFYHDVSSGDINGDGKVDVIGLAMSTYGDWKTALHPYLQNSDGSYSENRTIIDTTGFPDRSTDFSGSSILIKDLFGDNYPEIIRGQGSSPDEGRYGFAIYSYDITSNKYKYINKPNGLGDLKSGSRRTTSIRNLDYDKDGKQDLAIAFEYILNGIGGNGIQLFHNDGNGNFSVGQSFNYTEDKNQFREFEVADVNKDGYPDILIHPFHYGSLFRLNPGAPPNTKGNGVILQNCLWINNKGVFDFLKDSISVPLPNAPSMPGYMKGFFKNGQLRFFGFEGKDPPVSSTKFTLFEVYINFCNSISKPNFNTSKFSFCTGDSIKLSITNVNKGDTLKWFYGTKSDISNISSKTFLDSTKLYVTRTDSLGCTISSDTVLISKFSTPSAPVISRDTANNLISTLYNTTWYKDGTAISDTAQKIKPTTAGSYTAKTTQNGCTSAMSNSYYYLVTDVINLSAGEFIKLAPNPFNSFLNLDFAIKSNQRLNLDVFEISSGLKVASRQNLIAGNQINLGELPPGTYIVKVMSEDNKISYQFKMVKL